LPPASPSDPLPRTSRRVRGFVAARNRIAEEFRDGFRDGFRDTTAAGRFLNRVPGDTRGIRFARCAYRSVISLIVSLSVTVGNGNATVYLLSASLRRAAIRLALSAALAADYCHRGGVFTRARELARANKWQLAGAAGWVNGTEDANAFSVYRLLRDSHGRVLERGEPSLAISARYSPDTASYLFLLSLMSSQSRTSFLLSDATIVLPLLPALRRACYATSIFCFDNRAKRIPRRISADRPTRDNATLPFSPLSIVISVNYNSQIYLIPRDKCSMILSDRIELFHVARDGECGMRWCKRC